MLAYRLCPFEDVLLLSSSLRLTHILLAVCRSIKLSLLVGGASIAAVYGTHLSLVLRNTEQHQTAVREYPEASGENCNVYLGACTAL